MKSLAFIAATAAFGATLCEAQFRPLETSDGKCAQTQGGSGTSGPLWVGNCASRTTIYVNYERSSLQMYTDSSPPAPCLSKKPGGTRVMLEPCRDTKAMQWVFTSSQQWQNQESCQCMAHDSADKLVLKDCAKAPTFEYRGKKPKTMPGSCPDVLPDGFSGAAPSGPDTTEVAPPPPARPTKPPTTAFVTETVEETELVTVVATSTKTSTVSSTQVVTAVETVTAPSSSSAPVAMETVATETPTPSVATTGAVEPVATVGPVFSTTEVVGQTGVIGDECEEDGECAAWQACVLFSCRARSCLKNDDCPGDAKCVNESCTRGDEPAPGPASAGAPEVNCSASKYQSCDVCTVYTGCFWDPTLNGGKGKCTEKCSAKGKCYELGGDRECPAN